MIYFHNNLLMFIKRESMKAHTADDTWYGNLVVNLDKLKTRQLAEACLECNDKEYKEYSFDNSLDELFNKTEFYQDRGEFEMDSFGYTVLLNHQVACFDSGGEKLLCFPQVLELISDNSFIKIKLTMQKLGIIITDCSPSKLEVLHRNHILPLKTTYCGLISQSNAERLCKIFKTPHTKSTDPNQILSQNYFIPLKYRHQIRVVHDCFGQQKGILMPQLCTNTEAHCIECFDCGVWFSPSDFVGHTHNQSGMESEMSICHWGFTSSNWRLYLRLAEDPSRTTEEERSLNDYLSEIKNRYSQPVYDSLTICNDPNQQTPSDSCSFNTSPSMPTPTSLSPSDGLNKTDLQNSSSMFQQCIMRICNNHLENTDDRNQLINTLFMLRQEHHQQISTLISERQELIKALKKSPTENSSSIQCAEAEESKSVTSTDNSVNSMLQSVKEKIAILKRSVRVKKRSLSPVQKTDQIKEKNRKTSNPSEIQFPKSELLCSDDNQSTKEIIDCDSSSVRTELSEILSSGQQQETKND